MNTDAEMQFFQDRWSDFWEEGRAQRAVLRAFGDAQRATYKVDLAKGAIAHADHERGARFAAAKVLDGDPDSYWSTPDGVHTPQLVLDIPPGRSFDIT